MTDKIREVLNILDQENISYEILEHPPVYTIGEVQDAGLPKEEVIAKNLFVRDDRKDQYMLLVALLEKHGSRVQMISFPE